MLHKSLIVLSVLITLLSFVLLFCFYDQIPQNIPAFIDMMGTATAFMPKNYISVFRLPMMGVMLLGVCLTMFSVKPAIGSDAHERLWLSVSLLGAFKMNFTSLEILFYTKPILFMSLRIIVAFIIITAAINILLTIYQLYKTYNGNFSLYSSGITSLHKTSILFFLSGYLFFVFIPYFIQQ